MSAPIRLSVFLNGYNLFGKYLLIFGDEELIARVKISRFAITFRFYWQSISLEYFVLNPSLLSKFKIVLKQTARDFKKNGFKFIWNCFAGYRVPVDVKPSFGYLSFAIENDDRSAWISRPAVDLGVAPYALSHSIEYDLSRFPKKFSALIWGISGLNDHKLLPVSLWHKTRLTFKSVKLKVLSEYGSLVFQELKECQIYHGKSVVLNETLYPTDFDNCIDKSWPSDMAVSLPNGPAVITTVKTVNSYTEPSIFFGSSPNWFHFLVEIFPRYLLYGTEKIQNRTIVIENDVPPQIIEAVSLLSGKTPIRVHPFESAIFENLTVSMESRFPNGLDLVNRAPDLRLVRDFFRSNNLASPDSQNRRIFLIRNKNLFRHSKEIGVIVDFAKQYNFEFIDTGELTMKDQIRLFSEASFVVGETGSSLTNLLFCQSNCRVLELNLNSFMPGFFKEFCNALNLKHKSIDKVSINSGLITCESEGQSLNLEYLLS